MSKMPGLDFKWFYEYPMAMIALPKRDDEKLLLYNHLNRLAECIEKDCEYYLGLKVAIINKVKGKPKNMLTDDQLEQFLLDNIEELGP